MLNQNQNKTEANETEVEPNIVTSYQPILDLNYNIFGYEFFSRANMQEDKSNINHTAKSDTKTIFNLFSNFDVSQFLKNKKAFLNCILELSDIEDYIALLSPENVILEIIPPKNIDDINTIKIIYEKMKALSEKGFTISSSEIVFKKDYKEWFDLVSVIKIEKNQFIQMDQETKRSFLSNIMKAKAAKKIIIGEKVETQEHFEFLKKLKFDYFQGYFFSKPINRGFTISHPSTVILLRLINAVISQKEIKDLEAILKTEPTIAFKLLRYLNSYGVGGGEKIENFGRAISILGYKKLLKWLSILFTVSQQKKGSDAIAKTALTRAKLMESLAETIDPKNSDLYFMTGLFSMLDSMLDVDLSVVINSMNIDEEIKDAILHQKGKYFQLLQLVIYLEEQNFSKIRTALFDLKIPVFEFNSKHTQAMSWVEELKV